jgi:NAD(P)-dependent dehydrogenase (short-subunit alcohol dehydrogenase family)
MTARQELLTRLWQDVININLRAASLDNIIANCKRDPTGPFADTGAAIERMLAAGASRRDLGLVLRGTAYEAVFGTLYALG